MEIVPTNSNNYLCLSVNRKRKLMIKSNEESLEFVLLNSPNWKPLSYGWKSLANFTYSEENHAKMSRYDWILYSSSTDAKSQIEGGPSNEARSPLDRKKLSSWLFHFVFYNSCIKNKSQWNWQTMHPMTMTIYHST